MRVVADHLRGATFLAVDQVVPSNKEQGYVMRRLIRRAVRFAFELGIEQDLAKSVVPVITEMYRVDMPEVAGVEQPVIDIIDETIMSTTIAIRRGRLGFDFQKLPLSRTTKMVNNPPNSNISNEKVFSAAVFDSPK